jgi:hypothetical protein
MTRLKVKSLVAGMFVLLSSIDSYAVEVSQRWQSVGPTGISLGNEYDFKISLSDPDILYLRAEGALLKSNDGAVNWNTVQQKGGERSVANY